MMRAFNRKSGRLLATFGVVLLLSGCSDLPSWIDGFWQYDQNRSEKTLEASMTAGVAPDSREALNFTYKKGFLTNNAHAEIRFSGSEIMSLTDGKGRVDSFRVAYSTSDECVLRFKDDTVETYYRDGDDIYFFAGGGGTLVKVFLQRHK